MYSRRRDEESLKEFVEAKINVISAQARSEEQQTLDRERTLMNQVQNGMQAVSSMIKELKEAQNLQHKELTAVNLDAIQESVKKVEEIGGQVSKRQQFIERNLADQTSKMDILQTQSLKHARMTNETLAKEVGRIEKVMSTFEQFTKAQLTEVRSELTSLAADTGKWQVNFEDMQARKIIEIHQAIKVLNQNYLFMQKDAKDKFEILNSQQKSNQENIATRIGDLKK